MSEDIFSKSQDNGELLRHHVENFILTLKRDPVFIESYNRKDGDKCLTMFLVTTLDHSIMKFLQLQELLDNDVLTVEQEAKIMTSQVNNHFLFFAENFGLWNIIAKPTDFNKFCDKFNDFFLTGIKTMYNEMKNKNQ